MTGRFELTRPDAPLGLDGEVVQRYLRELVSLIDRDNPEMGGTPLPSEDRAGHDRDVIGLAHRMYGAVTFDRYTYVADTETPGGDR